MASGFADREAAGRELAQRYRFGQAAITLEMSGAMLAHLGGRLDEAADGHPPLDPVNDHADEVKGGTSDDPRGRLGRARTRVRVRCVG